MEFIATKRGVRAMSYGLQICSEQEGQRWKKQRLQLIDNTITSQKSHNHPADQAEKIVVEKKKSAKDSVRPIPTLYHETLQALATIPNKDEVALKLPTIEQIKTSLYDIQRKRLPTLPKSRSDVQFTDEWTMTSSGKPFLLADDGLGDNKLIMFATDDNIAILCEADTIYIDGTFQTCPKPFYQIYSIHAFKHG